MKDHNPIRDAVRYALSAGVAASFIGAPQMAAAQEDEDVADQGLITVTGSRIQRVDIEGPSPVSVISREDIEATGDISVAEVLRGSTFNQFGSFKTRSGSSAQGTSTISLRGLGAARTLVLLDGRRISGSPAFGAGSAQNLNVIPLEAVERIEVLRDGASAIYGSDAVGGVINVILRKDYEGLQLNGQIGRPTQSGGDEQSYGLIGGISSGQGNLTFALDHEEREIIFNGDRTFSATGLSAFGFPGSFFAGTTDQFGNFVSLGTYADPRCPTTLGGSTEFADSIFVQQGTNSLCLFNYAATSATESSFERDSFFLNGNYQVTENVGFFARGTFSKVDTFGRYAPTPFTAPFPTLSVDNANNPTAPGLERHPSEMSPNIVGPDYSVISGPVFNADGDQLGNGGTCIVDPAVDPTCMADMQNYTGPFDITALYRNTAGGFRDAYNDDLLIDFLAGFNGAVDLMGGMDWEIAAQHSTGISDQTSTGLGFAGTLDDRIDDETYDIFGVNGPTDFSVIVPSTSHTGLSDYEHRIASVDGQVTFDVAQMPAGPLGAAVGFEYRDEKFLQDFDAQQNAANVAGSAGAADTTGARVAKSLFAEVAIPIVDIVEVSVAGRYDDYNDFGTTFNPKVALGVRPIDSILLRASYGEGFRAPSMSELYSAPVQSFNAAIDTTLCQNSGQAGADPDTLPPGHPCLSTQFQNFGGGNANLDPELSESLNVGVVWNPLDDLSLSFDYFDVELEDQISPVPLQTSLDAEFAMNMGGTQGTAAVDRSNVANPIINSDTGNIAGTKSRGYDVDARYGFSLGAVGDFQTQMQVSKVTEYLQDLGDGNGFRRLQGVRGFTPDIRAALNLGWSRGDFSASVLGNHVADASNAAGNVMLSSWTTWDAAVGWATPWNGKITVGARNLFDRDPPTDPDLGNPNYTEQLHDIFGRVPYLRYEQNL